MDKENRARDWGVAIRNQGLGAGVDKAYNYPWVPDQFMESCSATSSPNILINSGSASADTCRDRKMGQADMRVACVRARMTRPEHAR